MEEGKRAHLRNFENIVFEGVSAFPQDTAVLTLNYTLNFILRFPFPSGRRILVREIGALGARHGVVSMRFEWQVRAHTGEPSGCGSLQEPGARHKHV